MGISLGAVLATTAQAQDNPNATVEEQATTSQIDTDYTPVAKDSELFSLVHGAEFGDTQVIEDSATTFSTELHDVAFQNAKLGLAAGSACEREPVQQGETNEEFGQRVGACEGTDETTVDRVPTLYRYSEPPNQDPGWEKLALSDAEDQSPGYVASIAWIDKDRALLVGGTGAYPRREAPADSLAPTDPAKPDQAGAARAWLYSAKADEASEIDLSHLTSDETAADPDRAGMRGLTAVDCFEDPKPEFQETPIELCFAGALGQIWEWRAGGEWGAGAFTGKRVDAKAPATELESAKLFRYRVRDVAFTQAEPPVAVAVTSGCCAVNASENTPRLLVYANRASGPARWDARSPFDRVGVCQAKFTFIVTVGGCYPRDVALEADDTRRETNDHPELPDSLYSLSASTSGDRLDISVIATPGDPESADDPPSAFVKGNSGTTQSPYRDVVQWSFEPFELLDTYLSTARLTARDLFQGDQGYSVGQLRSTERTGLGAQGLLVSSIPKQSATEAVNAGLGSGLGQVRPTPEELTAGWEPVDQQKLEAAIDSRHYLLPSYAANSVEIVGNHEDGWAVGDHGAILRLSASESQRLAGATEPKPPRLGANRSAPLSDRDAYEETTQPIPATAGIVPGIGAETTEVEEPQMLPSGHIGATQIVMSRDGSEGWAIGSDSGGATFSHYDGRSWRYCDPVGIEGLTEPDPACEAMATLRGWRDPLDGNLKTLTLDHATRVPLENDADPTNDDELEIVAIGGARYQGPEYRGERLPVVVRYHDGRWGFEEASAVRALGKGGSSAPQSIAFSTPSNGWLVSRAAGSSLEVLSYFRFRGKSWVDCTLDPGQCGDVHRLPKDPRELGGLTVAGERVYLFGSRILRTKTHDSVDQFNARYVPLILYFDGDEWTVGSETSEDRGGFDPGFADAATNHAGRVRSLSMAMSSDGQYGGWAVGAFGTGTDPAIDGNSPRLPPDTSLMRLGDDGWQRFQSPGAFDDYMLRRVLADATPNSSGRLQVSYPSSNDVGSTFLGQTPTARSGGRIFAFDPGRDRFEMLDSARPQGTERPQALGEAHPAGDLTSMAPDGTGGFWAAISGRMYHYTDRIPEPVFTETANPLGIRGVELRDLTGGPDGSVWIATDSDRVYRHDRVTGWEEIRVPGWDPGRVVTRASSANAIAIGPGGEGLLVGEGGRIANLSPDSVSLDPAAGHSCALQDPPPCSTSRELRAVDIASDGSAIAAGDRLALLWRPPGGQFQAIPKPSIASSTNVRAVSYPAPNRAYLAVDGGIVYRGDMSSPGQWSWTKENVTPEGELISVDSQHRPLAINDIAVDKEGHGYAVGLAGLVMERSETGGWSRVRNPYLASLSAVELPEAGGEGVLIGGAGTILTGRGDQLDIAHNAGGLGPGGEVIALAYLPGSSEGSVDAWAAIAPSGEGDGGLLRYRSDPDDPLLDPATSSEPLADAPAKSEGELSLAAFGKSDCELPESVLCPEMSATTTTNEVVSERIVDELADLRSERELDLAIQSGDATDSAGQATSSLADLDRLGTIPFNESPTQRAGQLKHRRYAELVADELADKQVPLFAAIGSQDLTETFACDTEGCETTKEYANAGENFGWREAFAGRTDPWGDGSDMLGGQQGELSFDPAPGSEENSLRVEDQRADADGEGTAPEAKAEIGGASTHYAIDATRDGEPIARIVFVDTSLRSLAASDPLQQPHELAGGQTRFLERMICREGETTTFGDSCTRKPDQKAIVVSNTPTYSYGPGALTHTALDATTFEALMLKHRVDLVISGALGYNGLYYTLAPGVHEPCPAGAYPEAPPSGRTPDCLAGPAGPVQAATEKAPAEASDPASLIAGGNLTGAYPTLIASGAGGKFGPDGNEPADGPAGQWHGYSLARLLPDGDLVVEQRPILDWIGLDAADHSVAPKSRLTLNGYGRAPVSTRTDFQRARAFHYEISTAAITHRYELLLADPERPTLPCRAEDPGCVELHANLSQGGAGSGAAEGALGTDQNPCAPYLCLPERIGTVDDQSGQIRAGDGKYPETFAIAMLSVDEEVATYPLVFKRSPSFVATPALRSGALPNTAGTRPTAPPPPPPPPGLPQIPQVEIPQIPPPPGIPQLTAATPPELQPPAPPAPPPPSQQPAPLDLSVAPPGVSISTPTALIQPPTPPVNPAPPGGARREARQRQAAAQKGGADSSEEQGSDIGAMGGDQAQGLDSPDQAMSRHDPHGATRLARERPHPSFTTLARTEQASAWSRGALYGGGIAFSALVLAFSWLTLRPTPRRREPELPAPARSFARR